MNGQEFGQDPATVALDRLTSVADASATELRDLHHDLSTVQQERQRGWSWRQIMSAAPGPQPLVRVAKVAADLAAAGGAFRRALAKALHSEGMLVTAIAALFDVSRQRVTTLIRSDSPTDSER